MPSQSTNSHAEAGHRLPHVPRLSIRYLLFTTALTALVLGLWRIVIVADGSPYPRAIDWRVLIVSLVLGWTGSAAGLIGWHAARRTLWRLEPGDWAAIGLAFLAAIRIALDVMYRVFFSPRAISGGGGSFWEPRTVAEHWREGIGLAGLLVLAAIYLAGAVTQRRDRWWSACFLVLAIEPLATAAVTITYWFDLLPEFVTMPYAWALEWKIVFCSAAILLLLAIAVVLDIARRPPRHWLHWTGVLLTAVWHLIALFAILLVFA